MLGTNVDTADFTNLEPVAYDNVTMATFTSSFYISFLDMMNNSITFVLSLSAFEVPDSVCIIDIAGVHLSCFF
ncbi:hypothetical protein PRLR5076_10420 [Prevotella lacticifex]|uniref:Uncharacterized protein n=1 Tax=Prevotella lacticifex TaxID=2854755 RepID=A0A9R1CVI4_9BACT|nr:hypothetical protein PRLR5027_26580 [Prevotella lacticifex]GJG58191.1 hypothetical protein PRLR5076_10420 [Prevotella lacticifex]